MSQPHTSRWDKLAGIYDPTLALSAQQHLPTKRSTRGQRFALRTGRALTQLLRRHSRSRARNRRLLSLRRLTLRRFLVILARRPLTILGPVLLLVLFVGLVITFVVIQSRSGPNAPVAPAPAFFPVALVVFILISLASSLARPHETILTVAVRLRREAILRHSPRFRRLHIDSGLHSSPVELSQKLLRRREYWRRVLERPRWRHRIAFAYVDSQWVSMVPLLYFLPQLMPLISFSLPASAWKPSPIMMGCAMPFLLLTAVLTPFVVGRRRMQRLVRSITDKSCPDCAYPLEHIDDAKIPKLGVIPGLGPRSCIECGCPWPLLPPPPAREPSVDQVLGPAAAEMHPDAIPPLDLSGSSLQRLRRGQCPYCGYDRAGLPRHARCPECASTIARRAPRPEPTPSGRPTCAACGFDMRGRESNRTCPECGVMSGITWVQSPAE
jgi:hypothetical protein